MELEISPLPIEPASCIFCKHGRGAAYYVSTGVHGPVGYLFICSDCLSEMAKAVGFKHISSVDEVVTRLEKDLEWTRASLERYELLHNVLREHGIDLANLGKLVSDEAAIARAVRVEEDRKRREDEAKQFVGQQRFGSSIYSPSSDGSAFDI